MDTPGNTPQGLGSGTQAGKTDEGLDLPDTQEVGYQAALPRTRFGNRRAAELNDRRKRNATTMLVRTTIDDKTARRFAAGVARLLSGLLLSRP